jgi:hypothetical protein
VSTDGSGVVSFDRDYRMTVWRLLSLTGCTAVVAVVTVVFGPSSGEGVDSGTG